MRAREWMDRYFRIRKCGGCGKILSFEECYEPLCSDCRRRWSIAKTESCGRCLQSASECTCQPRMLSDSGSLVLRKLFFYSVARAHEPQNRLLYYIKKKPVRRLFLFLASELSPLARQELSVLGLSDPYENVVIVSIPRGRHPRAIYGFDQAEGIARCLGLLLHIPYVPALYRAFGGRSQKHLSAKERRINMQRRIRTRREDDLRGKCVLLFDDVVTTGASMAACVSALQKAGAKHVIALSLFRTP